MKIRFLLLGMFLALVGCYVEETDEPDAPQAQVEQPLNDTNCQPVDPDGYCCSSNQRACCIHPRVGVWCFDA